MIKVLLSKKNLAKETCSETQTEIQVELISNCMMADNAWLRFKGLLGKEKIEMNEGMHIIPCNSIHTFFMKFAIDVVFLNKCNEVVAIISNMKPWRMSRMYFKAHSVLELHTGVIESKKIEIGDTLCFA